MEVCNFLILSDERSFLERANLVIIIEKMQTALRELFLSEFSFQAFVGFLWKNPPNPFKPKSILLQYN